MSKLPAAKDAPRHAGPLRDTRALPPKFGLPYDATIMVRDCCLCLHVQRAARSLARRFDEALRPLDLTHGQFSLLMSLNRSEPPTMAQVSSVLAMDRTTLTANIKPLERRGLLAVKVDAADRRSRRLSLTAAGHKILMAAMPVWKRTHKAIDRLVTATGLDDLRADLRALS